MSFALFTVVYPEMILAHVSWVNKIRHAPTPYTAPHFDLAFGVTDVAEALYLSQVEGVARRHSRFAFRCRSVIPDADHRGENGYAFLVPEEGDDEFRTLHSDLYRGPLTHALDPSAPYTPHMTLGRYPTKAWAQVRCEEMKQSPISVSGFAEQLSVVALENDSVTDIACFALSLDQKAH